MQEDSNCETSNFESFTMILKPSLFFEYRRFVPVNIQVSEYVSMCY